jgi:hypothetical protein
MINLYKQDLLNQLSDDEYQLWCHDLAVIKRVVTMITSFKSFEEVFLNTKSYYIPDYWKDGNLKYVDHYQPYRNLADLADNFLYGISVMDRVEKYYPLEYYPYTYVCLLSGLSDIPLNVRNIIQKTYLGLW